jgi:hypothetical protein
MSILTLGAYLNTTAKVPHEFFDHSATSEGWHVQWEAVPPGKESGPRSLGCIRGGNEAGEAN